MCPLYLWLLSEVFEAWLVIVHCTTQLILLSSFSILLKKTDWETINIVKSTTQDWFRSLSPSRLVQIFKQSPSLTNLDRMEAVQKVQTGEGDWCAWAEDPKCLNSDAGAGGGSSWTGLGVNKPTDDWASRSSSGHVGNKSPFVDEDVAALKLSFEMIERAEKNAGTRDLCARGACNAVFQSCKWNFKSAWESY